MRKGAVDQGQGQGQGRETQIPLENTLFLTENIKDCLHSDKKGDIILALDRLTGLLPRIDAVLEETMDILMEKAASEQVRAWSKSSKEKLTPIMELRRELKA